MKRIYTIIAAALLVTAVQAQDNLKSNYIGLNLGAGMNTILYNPVDGAYTPGLGFGASLQYAHFFGQHFGFGFGVQYAIHNAKATYNKTIVGDQTIVHPDNGYPYYPINKYNNWRERQTLNVLSIPVELIWRAAMSDTWAFMIGLGAQFDMTVGASYDGDGAYETQGQFIINGNTYAVSNLPDYGFYTYNNEKKGDINVNKNGVSVIADLGFNHSLSDNWGFYFGIYGGYGVSNLYDNANSNKELIAVNTTDASQIDYNSTLASDRIDAYNLVSAGLKLGVNLGWNCGHGNKADDGSLVPYATPKDKQAADKAAADKAAAEKAAAEKAAAEKAAAEKAAAEAADAARQAQYANDAALAQAMQNIDADLAAAEEQANLSGSAAAKSDVAKARAKAKQAKDAYNNGKYADANSLMREAYGLMAHSYAADADAYAKQGNPEAAEAASAAATYADAARNGDLASAMSAMRNAAVNGKKAASDKPASDQKQKTGNTNNTGNANNTNNTGSNGNSNVTGKPASTDKAPATDMASVMKNINLIGDGVHFEFNDDTPVVSTGAEIALRAIAAAMAADKSIKVTCVGHTDSIGGEGYNQSLGLRRAKALKKLLVDYGAPAANISTRSCGKSEPIAPNDTEENRARNRRAAIELKK